MSQFGSCLVIKGLKLLTKWYYVGKSGLNFIFLKQKPTELLNA